MFGDFLTLCFDQVVNHIAKYEAMYNGKVTCPVIIRAPSGGGRGYGPTHSQSLEKHFLGVPHLRVVASSLIHDPPLCCARCWRRTARCCSSSTSCSILCT
jgi:acetoin:2,6-dichlorophenolindophenol oxidoreductase subunit beta